MEVEKNYASRGVANTALGLGIGAVAAELIGGGLDGILNHRSNCEGDHTVNRYEAQKDARIAQLETDIKLRDANTYTDGKLLDMYKYVDERLRGVEAQIGQQSVINAQVTANLGCLQQTVAALTNMTKTIIPIDNVCPPPMMRYNSWTAPTTPAASAAG